MPSDLSRDAVHPVSAPSPARLRFYRAVRRRRPLVLATALLVTCASLFSARKLVWTEDLMDLLPHGDPVVADYRLFLDAFRPHDMLYFDIAPAGQSDLPDKQALLAAGDRLFTLLSASPHFDRILYRFDASNLFATLDTLRSHRPALFTADAAAALDKKTEPEAIRARLAGWRKVLLESPAPGLAPQFYRDPLGLDEPLLDTLADLREGAGGLETQDNHLFTADGRHLILMAHPRMSSTDGQHAESLVRTIENAVAEVRQTAPEPVRIAWMGGHRFAEENASRIKRDIAFTLSVSVAAISLLVFLTFSRPGFVPLALMPAAFGAAVASGVIPWITPAISAIAIGCGSMLVAIAVDYGIHILYHHDQASRASAEGKRGNDPCATLHALTPALLIGATTTLVAFLTLRVSVLPGYRQLGLFAAIGIGSAAACAMLVLPLFLGAHSGRAPARPRLLLTRWAPRWFAWGEGRRPAVAAGIVAGSLLALGGLPKVTFEGDMQKMNAVSDLVREDWDIVRHSLGSALDSVPIAVREPNEEAALRENEQLHRALGQMRDKGTIVQFHSLAPFLPSEATQEENRRRWREFWDSPTENGGSRLEAFDRSFRAACAELRLRPEAFQDFMSGLRIRPMSPLTPDSLRHGLLGPMLDAQVVSRGDGTLVLTRIELPDHADHAKVLAGLRAAFPDLLIGDGQTFTQHIVRLVQMELKRMAVIAAALVAGILLVVLRRPGRVVLLLTPLALSALWTFGAMGWLDVRINLINCIITILIFGLVVDYSVFLVMARERAAGPSDPHLARAWGAVTISALTTMIGLGSLALAQHPALHAIGLTALMGIGSGWGAVVLLVGTMRGWDGKRKTQG